MPLDLVVLVPDKDIEQALGSLLKRHQSLGIRPLDEVKIITHPGRDPGVYNTGHALLDPFVGEAGHALIVFDRKWEGAPTKDPLQLARYVEQACHPQWGDKARCVCIDPEIENWIWSDSPHVHAVLGWSGRHEMIAWLRSQKLWPDGMPKPPDPKAAFEAATRKKNVVPSSSIFAELACHVSLKRCQDPSFLLLIKILKEWFPPQ